MAKPNPQGMKTSYKYRVVWGTWTDDTNPKETKLNIMSNEDRKRLGLPIDEQLEGQQDDKHKGVKGKEH